MDAPLTGDGDASSFADLVAAPGEDWVEQLDRGLALEAMEAAIEGLEASEQQVLTGVLAGASSRDLGITRARFQGCLRAVKTSMGMPVPVEVHRPRVKSRVVPLRVVPPAKELVVALRELDLLAV